jgi:hypothetical protein
MPCMCQVQSLAEQTGGLAGLQGAAYGIALEGSLM